MTITPTPSRVEDTATTDEIAENAFYSAYGQALANWGRIEAGLFQWFAFVTAMPPITARAVFYSASSFRARREMLEAARSSVSLPTELDVFLKTITAKAKTYSSFRNRLAHGEFNSVAAAEHPDLIVDQVLIDPNRVDYSSYKKALRRSDIDAIARNFACLADIIWGSHSHRNGGPLALFDVFREQVERLPSEADKAGQSRKQLGRQLQQRSAAKSKKRKSARE